MIALRRLLVLLALLLLPLRVDAANRFWVGGTGTWDNVTTTHWSASSGGGGGASVPGSSDVATLDASSGGGTVTLNYSPTVTQLIMGAFTGTFADGGNQVNAVLFSITGTGVRTINATAAEWDLSGSPTPWDATTSTNLTVTSLPTLLKFTSTASPNPIVGSLTYNDISFTGNGATPTISGVPLNLRDLTVSIGSGSSIWGTFNARNVTLTTTTCTSNGGTRTITGNLTVTAATSCILGGGVTLAGTSGTQTITVGGLSGNTSAWVINNTGATAVFTDAISSTGTLTITAGAATFNGTTSFGAVTHTAGTLILNGLMTSPNYSSNNANVRALTVARLWTLTSTGTLINITTATNGTFTCTPGGYFVASDTSSTAKLFTVSGTSTCWKFWTGTVANGWTVTP